MVTLAAEIFRDPLHHSRRGLGPGAQTRRPGGSPGGYGATDPEKSLQEVDHFIQFDPSSKLNIFGTILPNGRVPIWIKPCGVDHFIQHVSRGDPMGPWADGPMGSQPWDLAARPIALGPAASEARPASKAG